jgi:pimeloyl-ACP methyl ester carboxylesterase
VRRVSRLLRACGATLCIFAAGIFVVSGKAAAYTNTTDVVFVHGYGNCQNPWISGAGPLLTQYDWRHEPVAKLHAIEYYGCDWGGESIVGAGPNSASYYPDTIDDNGQNTDIRHLGYELAWYLWDHFGSKQLPVDLVGHSMGGLIITYALQRVAAHDPQFPPHLTVPTVVTFSTPFAGASVGCAPSVECSEIAPDSAFVHDVMAAGAPQLAGGTLWLLMGSSAGCDAIPASSTLALPRATWRVDYRTPCYLHTSYVWDTSAAGNATGTLNGKSWTGPHSLAFMAWSLR